MLFEVKSEIVLFFWEGDLKIGQLIEAYKDKPNVWKIKIEDRLFYVDGKDIFNLNPNEVKVAIDRLKQEILSKYGK